MSIGALVLILLVSGLTAAPVASRDGTAPYRGKRARKHRERPRAPRRLTVEVDADGQRIRDYWERLVATPSELAQGVLKEGVLPVEKYSMATFDVEPFEVWLREYSLLPQPDPAADPAAQPTPRPAIPPPPLSFICGVWYSPLYKFIFVRNRKTASSTFLTAVKKFMMENNLCNSTKALGGLQSNNCILRMEPEQLGSEGINVDDMWRDYLVITSTRNPWARAASGYQFTFDKWQKNSAGCAQPTFQHFCRDPFIMGKLSNLFNCVSKREGVGSRHDGHWNFDFCHVEPAAPCMVNEEQKLVVDFVIRYERLDEDMQAAVTMINSRRPTGLPPIVIPDTIKWRNKGTTARAYDINSTDEAAYVYADNYRQCGTPCVNALADFYATDLQLFGWDRPVPPPPAPVLDGAGDEGQGPRRREEEEYQQRLAPGLVG